MTAGTSANVPFSALALCTVKDAIVAVDDGDVHVKVKIGPEAVTLVMVGESGKRTRWNEPLVAVASLLVVAMEVYPREYSRTTDGLAAVGDS